MGKQTHTKIKKTIYIQQKIKNKNCVDSLILCETPMFYTISKSIKINQKIDLWHIFFSLNLIGVV